MKEARLHTATLRFSPELPISLGKTWLSQPWGQGYPQPLSKGLSLRGHLMQLHFGPGRGAFAALLPPPSPFDHTASSGHPVQPRVAGIFCGNLLQISPSPTHTSHLLQALTLLSASRQGGNKITSIFSYLSREHPASLCLLWSATLLCGEHPLRELQSYLTLEQGQLAAPQADLLWLGEKGARWELMPASHQVHQSPPHLAQKYS